MINCLKMVQLSPEQRFFQLFFLKHLKIKNGKIKDLLKKKVEKIFVLDHFVIMIFSCYSTKKMLLELFLMT